MNKEMAVRMTIKCTTCFERRDATPRQMEEAEKRGCYISDCCQAVAIIVNVRTGLNNSPRVK